jgi:hypothetical protein
MQHDYAVKLLDIYVGNAWQIFNAGFGCDRAEAAMFAVIDLLREFEELRPDFLQRVSLTSGKVDCWGTEPGAVPRELIELAIHELRWPEFLQLIEHRRLSFKHDRSHIALLEAFEANWPDREYYQRYQG